MTETHTAFLGLGTNLGDKEANIARAVELIGRHVGRVVALSSLHATEPVGFSSPNNFLNAAARVETTLGPRRLLQATQEIERAMGRTRKSSAGIHHDRIIDIDILLYDDVSVDEPDLKIPHPGIPYRQFVQIPLAEIS